MAILNSVFRIMATVGACLVASVAIAAEIRNDPSGGTVLEGTIQPGDFEKLRRFIVDGDGAFEFYLASPGGDLVEAMKIGSLLRALKVSTIVPDRLDADAVLQRKMALRHGIKDFSTDYMCASACFFVFIAGIYRNSDHIFDADPILGIHRPYLSDNDLKQMRVDQAIAAATSTKAVVGDYLRVMGVPTRYLDRMFSVSKDDIQWISDGDFEADFEGFIPELRDWVDARCDKNTPTEKKIWEELKHTTSAHQTPAEKVMVDAILKKLGEQDKCELDLRSELALRAYQDALERGTLPLPK
jgi:hypothetical protein